MMFGYREEELKKMNAYYTSKEIVQQPKLWEITYQLIKSQKEEIKSFIKKNVNKDTRIIFVGAGTSDYVGDTIRNQVEAAMHIPVESIATTDIVSSPEMVIDRERKTILVSFARSGNSPESIGAYRILEDNTDDITHIVITCNKEGKLAKEAIKNHNNYVILLPEETNDKGFAMTSSFSCMMLAALLFFDIDRLEKNEKVIEIITRQGQKIISHTWKDIKKISDKFPKRVVYLGSGCFCSLAQELALKNMELTNGEIVTIQESVLGFRHGPKTFMNDNTVVIVLMSQNKYTNEYNKDLIEELHKDLGAHSLIVLSYQEEALIKNCDSYIHIGGEQIPEIYTTFMYTLFGQIFAFLNSIALGVQPDNPSPQGTVNRVVKGVILHSYKIFQEE